jgi:MFS family permease
MCRTPLLPLFARELGAGPAQIGLVMGASTLTGIFVKLPAGALSDLLGRRRLLLIGGLVFATMPFTYLTVTALPFLILLRFVHGSATAIFGPVAAASVSDLAPAGKRGAWMSMYSTAQGTGQAIAPVIAGYLIAGGGFGMAFTVAGAIGAAVPLILLRWHGPSTTPRRLSWHELQHGVVAVARDRLVLATSGAQAAQFVLNGALNAFMPLYGRDVLRLSTTELGWLFALQTLTTLAIRPVIGLLSDRAGRRWVIVTGLTVCGLAVLSLSAADGLDVALVAVTVYSAGVAVTTAATGAFITDVTHRARYGAAHGVFGTIYDVGDALGPLAGGLLVASFGYGRMFQILATVALTVAVAFAIATRGRIGLASSMASRAI